MPDMDRNRCLAFYVDMVGVQNRLFGEQTRMLEELSMLGKDAGIDVVVLIPGYINSRCGLRFLPSKKTWVKVQAVVPSIVIRRSGTFSPNKRIQARRDLIYFAKHRLLHTLPFECSNKWKLYRVLHGDPLVRPFLPFTLFASSPGQVYNAMRLRKDIYVKPLSGAQGICIYRFMLEPQNVIRAVWEERIVSRDTERRTKRFQPETRLREEKISGEWGLERFWPKTGLKQCIIQDTVFLQNDEEGRPFDFRWLVQSSDLPVIIARVARVGKQNGVTTNIHTGGTAMEAERVLQKLPPKEQQAFISQMDDVANKVVSQLDCQYGHFAEVGIDLAVDVSGRIFIFEVNPTPGRRMLRALSPSLREISLQTIIEYASRAIESHDS
jgi:hypothetical protein